jgi:hypothetical protein
MKTNYINQLQRDIIGEIGRDEPQETLEEAAEKYANELPEPYNYGINSDKKKGFIEGAKWKQEQDKNNEKELYSEIEYLIINWSNDGTETAGALTRQIIEQFKKK